jgi:hypothetical protein
LVEIFEYNLIIFIKLSLNVLQLSVSDKDPQIQPVQLQPNSKSWLDYIQNFKILVNHYEA